MCNLFCAHRNVFGLLILLGIVLAPHARAEVLQIDAAISAEVQEFVAGEEGSFDSAFEEFGTTSAVLPIQVIARLLPPEDAETTDFIAATFVDFRDPTASETVNPREFGLEMQVYSQGSDLSFANHAVANETRHVVFSAAELDLEEDKTERLVQSHVFASGAVVIWSQDPTRDLTGLSVILKITVEQLLPESDPVEVFGASVTAEGTSDGSVVLDAPDGIFALLGGPELIRATAGFTEDQLLEELAALGNVYLVIIPEQSVPYSYTGPEGVEFSLKATVEAWVVNLPGGTGIGAVFGRPFEALAQAVGESVGAQTKGAVTQAAVNQALANARAPSRSEPRNIPAAATPWGACGALGVGTLAMALGLPVAALCVRRWD